MIFNIKPRAVQSFRYAVNKNSGSIMRYQPKETQEFKRLVTAAAKRAVPATFKAFEHVVGVRVVFFLEPPKIKLEKFRALEAAGVPFHVDTKPDLDNLQKGFLDALTGVLWSDDCLIAETSATKRYGYPARIEIEITELNQTGMEQQELF